MNPRPPAPKAGALPLRHSPLPNMASDLGINPMHGALPRENTAVDTTEPGGFPGGETMPRPAVTNVSVNDIKALQRDFERSQRAARAVAPDHRHLPGGHRPAACRPRTLLHADLRSPFETRLQPPVARKAAPTLAPQACPTADIPVASGCVAFIGTWHHKESRADPRTGRGRRRLWSGRRPTIASLLPGGLGRCGTPNRRLGSSPIRLRQPALIFPFKDAAIALAGGRTSASFLANCSEPYRRSSAETRSALPCLASAA